MMRNHRHIQKARSSETAKKKHLLIIAYIFCLVLATVKRSGLFFTAMICFFFARVRAREAQHCTTKHKYTEVPVNKALADCTKSA
jgi:hypothetical protein